MTNRVVRAGGVFLLGWLVASGVSAAAERPARMTVSGVGATDPHVTDVGTAGDPLEADGDPLPCTAGNARLPANLRAHVDLLPRIAIMLRRSPTFRRQCRRLAAAPWVHVKVRIDPSLSEQRTFRARSVIQRPQSNLIVAVISVQASEEPATWIAHELEHVIEQMETVDLDVLSRQRKAAWRTGQDMFETARAIRAGERVLAEVREFRPSENNFVDD